MGKNTVNVCGQEIELTNGVTPNEALECLNGFMLLPSLKREKLVQSINHDIEILKDRSKSLSETAALRIGRNILKLIDARASRPDIRQRYINAARILLEFADYEKYKGIGEEDLTSEEFTTKVFSPNGEAELRKKLEASFHEFLSWYLNVDDPEVPVVGQDGKVKVESIIKYSSSSVMANGFVRTGYKKGSEVPIRDVMEALKKKEASTEY